MNKSLFEIVTKFIWSYPAVLAVLVFLVPASAGAYDRSEQEGCAGCHYTPVMPFTAGTYLESNHADSYQAYLGNTYCASCHSPFQADPDATHSDSVPVPLVEWEAVTCGSCHPPHDLRVLWGTPIGTYDIATEEWTPVYEDEANVLCENCHSGSRHSKDFQGFGQSMAEHKGVRCIDCHMPKVPNEDLMTRTHNFAVVDNVQYSCGVGGAGCHANHKVDWAVKQILKEKIHQSNENNSGGNK